MNRLTVLFLLLLSAGCRGGSQPPSDRRDGHEFLRCADAQDDGRTEKISLPPLTAIRNGSDLKITGGDSAVVRVGLLAGLSDTAPETLTAIKYFLDRFKAARVQAIIVAGDTGRTESQIRTILDALAQAPIPILVIPGAQESFHGFRNAIAALRTTHPQIVDLTLVRRVFMKNICFLSLPGEQNPFYLEAGDQGCSYEPEDVTAIVSAAPSNMTAVLVSPTPPRGRGPAAADRGRGAVNIGDPAITDAMVDHEVRFGLHGHVVESGGSATPLSGEDPIPPGLWHTSFILQAGSASAAPVLMANGGRSAGMAHIVEFSGNRGRYRTLYAP